MISRLIGGKTIRMFGTGLVLQILLSAANFLVGLILIRRTTDLQYGYYVLVTNGLLLLTSIQGSFLQPQTVISLTRLDSTGRRDVVGGMVRLQHRSIPWILGAASVLPLILWLSRLLSGELASLLCVALLSAAATMRRDFFRMVLFAYHRPDTVLRSDVVYVILLVAGAFIATLTPLPAHAAVVTLALSAGIGAVLLARALWRHEPWNIRGAPDILRQVTNLGAWSVAGSAIHWILNQGYGYFVAGMINVQAVAALAATRLTMMPIFVLSGGVGTILFPLTSGWVHRLGVRSAARRLFLLASALTAAAICYFAVMWYLRDWIFGVLLKKHFHQRDALLLLWGVAFIITLCRDQFLNLLAACERFRQLTILTGISTILWLISSYIITLRYGAPGAVAGIVIGESFNLTGILICIRREIRQSTRATD